MERKTVWLSITLGLLLRTHTTWAATTDTQAKTLAQTAYNYTRSKKAVTAPDKLKRAANAGVFDARHTRFTVDPKAWQQHELTASNGKGDRFGTFGSSVALSSNGTTALVGAFDENIGSNIQQGAAYVYSYSAATSTWTQSAELTASNGSGGDRFGTSVALSSNGRTALIGADYKTINGNSNQGAAYIYTYDSATRTWKQTAELIANNGAANDNFGYSVALSGDGTTALVGACCKSIGSNSNQGAAYIYTYDAATGTWNQTTELTASNGAANDAFGYSVALSSNGTTALVGANDKTIGNNSDQGAAYIYTHGSTRTWKQAAELTAGNGGGKNDFWGTFGSSVALSSNGTTALVGAPEGLAGDSAAYVYADDVTTGTWSQLAKLTDSDAVPDDDFGYSVALSSNGATALVGAGDKNIGSNLQQGAAYVYTYNTVAGTWKQAAKLTASDGAAKNYFGTHLALSADGTTALIGASKTIGSNSDQGVAYLLTRADVLPTRPPETIRVRR